LQSPADTEEVVKAESDRARRRLAPDELPGLVRAKELGDESRERDRPHLAHGGADAAVVSQRTKDLEPPLDQDPLGLNLIVSLCGFAQREARLPGESATPADGPAARVEEDETDLAASRPSRHLAAAHLFLTR
jgi:hypothetical protein